MIITLKNTIWLKFKMLFCLTSISTLGLSQEARFDSLFSRGNTFYISGDYEKAISAYQSIAAQKIISSQLYYNLANAYLKKGDLAESIYNYEKSLNLDPSDQDVLYNLKFANSKIVDNIVPLPDPFYTEWIRRIIIAASPDDWAVAALIMSMMVALFFALFLLSNTTFRKKLHFVLFAISILGMVVLIVMANAAKEEALQMEAIIFSEAATIKSSPDEKSMDLFLLHLGTKVEVADSISTWRKIYTADKQEGWIRLQDIKII